jgi:hypothetical protein
VIIHPELLADKGCWISGDRTYAFVSATLGGITVVGYHGAQPVSRNSRVFRGGSGAIRFFVRAADGHLAAARLTAFDWLSGTLSLSAVWDAGSARLSITAGARSIVIEPEEARVAPLLIAFSPDALTTDVHGNRTWSEGSPEGGTLRFEFRDLILLDEWMRREGPYAGDFLIPEPLRRKIFRRRCRSGSATREDLLPEYRDRPLPVYDASVRVALGGPAFEIVRGEGMWLFVPDGTASPPADGGGTFTVSFDTEETAAPVIAPEARKRYGRIIDASPSFRVPGCPAVEEFAGALPAVVESCLVRDLGVPRATPGEYYWIWAWDSMVTALASLRWGDTSGALQTAAFVDAHRDEGSLIPMRWTRSLEPLDTQGRGALESLLASLAHAAATEGGNASLLRGIFPRMAEHLEAVGRSSDARGLFANPGFYPDLPFRFGRTEESAVALEVGMFYTFCQTFANIARLAGEDALARQAESSAERIERSFLGCFWDADRGFLLDSVTVSGGEPNRTYPLFSLLFLHSPLGWPLLRNRISECAAFISRHLLTESGLRLLPAWDRNARSETVSGAWYPHWDVYALKVLRRAGRAREILLWLRAMEEVLRRLGYAPEYLMLDGLGSGDESAWLRHGTASNLNCATGWYQALIEGVYGLEADPGGLTVIPLRLGMESAALSGFRYGASRWEITVRERGPVFRGMRVDGALLEGTLKIPASFTRVGSHALEIEHGERPGTARGAARLIRELVNAELMEVELSAAGCEARIRSFGRAELVFSRGEADALFVDDLPVPFRSSGQPGLCVAILPEAGEHGVRISPAG